jgi:hypothetical protein
MRLRGSDLGGRKRAALLLAEVLPVLTEYCVPFVLGESLFLGGEEDVMASGGRGYGCYRRRRGRGGFNLWEPASEMLKHSRDTLALQKG